MSYISVFEITPMQPRCFVYILCDGNIINAETLEPIPDDEYEFKELNGSIPVWEQNDIYYSYPLNGRLCIDLDSNNVILDLGDHCTDLKGHRVVCSNILHIELPDRFDTYPVKAKAWEGELYQISYRYFLSRYYMIYNNMKSEHIRGQKIIKYSDFMDGNHNIISQYLEPLLQPLAGSNRNYNRIATIQTDVGVYYVRGVWDPTAEKLVSDPQTK
jgi:hypothetical protein